MKYPKISYVIGAVGLFVLIISWGQWFFKYQDPSQLFLGTMIALNILAWAYLYSWMKEKDKAVVDWENKFQGIMKLVFKKDFEDET